MSKNNFYLHSPETSTSSLSRNPSQPYSRTTSKSSNHTVQHQPTTPQQHRTRSYTYDFDSDDDNDDDDDDDTSLPFPAPLPRSDFLAADFNPSTYLSTLASTRYQTLEDLRTELRTRSQQLNHELLELVNAHHEDFIGLGRSLKGGEEKIEEVRVGVLGFQREIQDVRGRLREKEMHVEGLLARRKRLRDEMEVGRKCVDLEERVALLEGRLGIAGDAVGVTGAGDGAGTGHDASSDEEDDDDEELDELERDGDDEDDDDDTAVSVANTTRRVQALVGIEHLADRIGREHPFVDAQKGRLEKLRSTLLLDLGTVLKQLKSANNLEGDNSKAANVDRRLRVLGLYRAIGASKDAVEILQADK